MQTKFGEIEMWELFMPMDRDVIYRKVSLNTGRLQITRLECDFSFNEPVRRPTKRADILEKQSAPPN